jgi:hypothetical protein
MPHSTPGSWAALPHVFHARRSLSVFLLAGLSSLASLASLAGAQPTPKNYPPPPVVTSPEWFQWYDGLLAARLAACPRERAITCYFSQAGDDATGTGSVSNPWKSLAKAAQVLAANTNGGIALLFRRGDVWREQVGLDSTAPNVTIADYGEGDKPLFTPFVPFDPSTYWVRASGTQNTWWHAASGDITWVKQGNNFDLAYAQQVSIASVEASEGSWYYDELNRRIYVHPWHERLSSPPSGGLPGHITASGAANPNSLPMEYVRPTDAGIIIRGHGSRLENLATIGWGMQQNVPSQQHGIEARCVRTDECVIVRCDSHYGSSHAMVHLAAGSIGGIATFVECTAGLTMYNNAGETIFNTFSYQGNQEAIFHRCVATQGTLHSFRWAYNDPAAMRRGVGFYGHTGGDALGLFNMFISYGCRTRAGGVRFQAPSNCADLPDVSNLSQVRGFFVNEDFEGGLGSGANFPVAPVGSVRLNGYYRSNPARGSALANWPQGGWIINTTFDLDLRNQNGLYAMYNGLEARPSLVRFWNCGIFATTAANTLFRFDYDSPSQSAGSTLANSVVVNLGPGQVQPNLGTTPGTLRSNAYYGIAPDVYAGDVAAVVLSTPPASRSRPPCGSALACASWPLPDAAALGFDAWGWEGERRTIGPLEAPRCGDFNGDTNVDFFDYLDFVQAWGNEEPSADVDGNGQVDFFDYLAFVARTDGGC